MNNKKSQEEITGFAIIIIVVIIIGLVFLAILLRKPSDNIKSSKEIDNFLESLMQTTSDCAINYEPKFSNIGQLLKDCRANKRCTSGQNSCEVLENELKNAIILSWNVGENSSIKGYKFRASYNSNISKDSKPDPIINLESGNCSSTYKESEDFISHSPGMIMYSFRLCY